MGLSHLPWYCETLVLEHVFNGRRTVCLRRIRENLTHYSLCSGQERRWFAGRHDVEFPLQLVQLRFSKGELELVREFKVKGSVAPNVEGMFKCESREFLGSGEPLLCIPPK
jgi:hypothetical protein